MKTASLSQSQPAVTVGLSGGVDSSVAALLLQQQGYAVQAVFMKNWEEDDTDEYCTAARDLEDAEAVAQRLALPLHGVNFADQYWDRVFAYFLAEYRAGRTPNPDILCNSEIKFRAFLDYALEHGAEKIATGHYARIAERDGTFLLLKGKDPGKDQSYFLHRLNQYQLAHSLFPVGELHKQQVRQLAEQHQLATHAKKDSTGICFIGERRFKDFLQRYLPVRRGEIRDLDGRVLGHHDGLMYYTRGQRQGLHLGGVAGGSGQPWYVADKDLAQNILYVVQGHDHPRLYSQWLVAEDAHWIAGKAPQLPLQAGAKTRYRQEDSPCRILQTKSGHWRVEFDAPQWAVTPGQAVVFYQDEVCLGGATIVAADHLAYGQAS